jgi:hypothetical protein
MRGSPDRRVRFPIAALMALIALIAVEMASLRVASDGFVDLSRHLTVAMLAVATYLARYREGDRAAWWFGFALLGWSYFALVVDASSRSHTAMMISRRELPPVTMLGLLMFLREESWATDNPLLLKYWWNQFEILQSIFTLVLASLGGLVFWMWGRHRGAPYRQEESRSGRLELDDRAE